MIAVLIWETASANIDDMSTMLKALSTEIDMAVLHEDLDPGNIHSLISMVNLPLPSNILLLVSFFMMDEVRKIRPPWRGLTIIR